MGVGGQEPVPIL